LNISGFLKIDNNPIQFGDLTTTERNNIINPIAGMMIYNITDNELNYYNGTNWTNISSGVVATPNHNLLNGLQGGTALEYYHLTSDQYSKLVAGSSGSINNQICVFDQTTGKIIKNSSVLCDLGNIYLPLVGSAFLINNVSVLNATTLGTNIINSSLTSFGTLSSLTVDNINLDSNTITATSGDLILTSTSGCLDLRGGNRLQEVKACKLSLECGASSQLPINNINFPMIYALNSGSSYKNGDLVIQPRTSQDNDIYINVKDTSTTNSVNALKISGGTLNSTFQGQIICPNIAGSGSGNPIHITSSGQLWENTSSRRYKKSIQNHDINTEFIYKLNMKNYTNLDGGNFQHGFIAEELNNYDDAKTFVNYKKINNVNVPNGIDYSRLVCPMIEEMKKLKDMITDLKLYTKDLEYRISEFER
jgi:hypothetical protein